MAKKTNMRTWELHDFATGRSWRKTQITRPREPGRVAVTKSYPASDPPPDNGSAADWDAWRNRHGGAVHH
jgi:hypothetical protein